MDKVLDFETFSGMAWNIAHDVNTDDTSVSVVQFVGKHSSTGVNSRQQSSAGVNSRQQSSTVVNR